MKPKLLYGLWTWVMLFAFCAMMTVKDTHCLCHHHDHCCGATICVLDGEPLDCHHHHNHSSFLAFADSEDHCAICQFQVVKVQKPSFTAYICPATAGLKIDAILVVHYFSVSFDFVSPRAPPMC